MEKAGRRKSSFKWIIIIAGVLFIGVLVSTVCLLYHFSGAQKVTAAIMHLYKTEGKVYVSDEKNNDLSMIDDMGLYDGYQVSTRRESYAWIDLDQERVVKLDEQSDVSINQKNRELELTLEDGNLFFGITTPLESDESLNIQTSNVSIGIRGTVGYVKAVDDTQTNIILLEGTVTCETADQQNVTLESGQAAEIVKQEDGTAAITKREILPEDLDQFVLEALEENETARNQVEEVWDYKQILQETKGESADEPAEEDPFVLVEYNTYDAESGELLKTYTYEYDQEGKKIQSQLFEDNRLNRRTEWEYDENGNLTQSTAYSFDSKTGEEYKDFINLYDEHGETEKETYFHPGSDDTDSYYWENVYDENGMVTYRIKRYEDESTGTQWYYEYDEHGKNSRVVLTDEDGNVKRQSDYENEYDADGNRIRSRKHTEYSEGYPKKEPSDTVTEYSYLRLSEYLASKEPG